MHTKTTTHTEIAHTHAISDTHTILGVRIRILTIIPVGAPALGHVQRLVGGWEAADCNNPDRLNTETNTNTNMNTTFNAIQNAMVVVFLTCVYVCVSCFYLTIPLRILILLIIPVGARALCPAQRAAGGSETVGA